VATDSVLAQELRALQEELAALLKERSLRSEGPPPATDAKLNRDSRLDERVGEQPLAGELRELENVIAGFVEDAEQTISKHPTASVIGALTAGILIGCLMGRR